MGHPQQKALRFAGARPMSSSRGVAPARRVCARETRMFRDSKLARGLADWLLSGVAARLDFLERDVEGLQGQTERLKKDQEGLTRVVGEHHARLQQHSASLNELSQMHQVLAGRIGQEFPGQICKRCGSAMVFERAALRKAYTLSCPKGCGDTLVLPERNLLETIRKLPLPS